MIGSDVSVVLDQENFGLTKDMIQGLLQMIYLFQKINLFYQKEFLQFVNKKKIDALHGQYKRKKLSMIK